MIIKEDSQLGQLLTFIEQNDVLAYDTETTGLNPRKDKVIGFGISNGTDAFYVAHLVWNGTALVQHVSAAACQTVINALLKKKLVFWNTSFDARMTFHNFGINLLPAVHSDGMLAFHTVQEEGVPFAQRPFGLKTVAPHFLGSEVTSEQADMKASIKANGGTPTEFYKADLEPMAHYCKQDCLLTFRLNEMFLQKIEDEGLTKFYFDDEVMPLLKHVTIPMELKGIPVDVAALEQAQTEISADLASLESRILSDISPLLSEFNQWYLNKEHPPKRTGPFAQAVVEVLLPNSLPRTGTGSYSMAAKHVEALPEGLLKDWLQEKRPLPSEVVDAAQLKCQAGAPMFNLLSKHHLKKLFFEKLNCTPLSRTDLGAPQVDEHFLDSVAAHYPWVPLLIQYNKLTKVKGTYIERFLDEQEGGMYYPSFFQHRTTSGRYGSNLQQLPRPLTPEDEPSELVRKYNNMVRAFFISGEGHSFLDSDYNSLEVVVFADDAGDEALLNMIRNDLDFYSTVAIGVLGLSQYSADKKATNFLKKHQPKARQDAKVYGLGIRYGMEAFKLSKTLNIGQQEAEQIIRGYFEKYPQLKGKMDFYETHAKTYGWVQSKAGRKRHLPRLKKLYETHGDSLSNSLEVWKKYHETPAEYERMKKIRRDMNNLINNALNFPIQSLAASIVNQSAIALARYIEQNQVPAYICLNVHDQLVTRVASDWVEKLKPIKKQIMENTIRLAAPLVADPAVASNLRDGH